MTLKVGINGFGRIGRLSLRAAFAWYDNEWGYANRLAELVRKVGVSL